MVSVARRRFLAGLGAVAVAGVLPGCQGDPRVPAATTDPSRTAPGGRFPVTVDHRYGQTVVSSAPRRIVALGQTDLDPVAALGFEPPAVGSFTDSSYTPVRPWNAAYFPTPPGLLNMLEPEFEKIAALEPDLILAVMSGISHGDYRKLAGIAPTVAQHRDYADWAVPYRPHTELIGAALGKRAEAARLLTGLDLRFAAVRSAHPEFSGKTAICAEMWGSEFDVLGASSPRTQFLSDIGLTPAASLVKLVGRKYNAPLSAERLDLLDGLDVVLWSTDHSTTDKLLSNRMVSSLRSTREGRFVLAPNGGNDDLLYSMDWGTVLSSHWAIDRAVPRFVKAVDGDPDTDPNA
jgi:iron complex transport system substrate-binding protein